MLYDSIPVVMHHHVSPVGTELNVYPDNFEDQLRALHNKGWKTLSGAEFLHFIKSREVPRKCILLTFDDGFLDNYLYAYPLLKKYKMKGMLFAATALVEDADIKRDDVKLIPHNAAWAQAFTDRRSEVICTWKELREMEESGVIDVQSHGVSHRIPNYIQAGKYPEIREDLSVSKQVLEERLSKKILHLAWPSGDYNSEVIKIAGGLGYEALYTTERGCNTDKNLTMVKRLPAKNRKGRWLMKYSNIYSSVFLTRFYLAIRTGI